MEVAMEDWVDVETPENGKSNNEVHHQDPSVKPATSVEHDGRPFYSLLEESALRRFEQSKTPLFHVDLGDEPIYDTFVKNMPSEMQKEFNCSSCRKFANRFGDLAMVDDNGSLTPLLWCETDFFHGPPETRLFLRAIQAVQWRFLENNKVTAEFKIVEKTRGLGTEERGGFSHMRLRFPESAMRKTELPGYTSANTQELAAMLQHVLSDYKLGTVRKAYSYLKEDKLPNADSHKASAKWLLEMLEEDKMGKAKGPVAYHNLLYRYAASSFIGSLKQMRSGALATLLEDVKCNRPWNYIQTSWKKINDPTAYMRPSAPPKAGNIEAAERLFTQLGLTKDDLRRRLLVQDEVPEGVIMWSSEKMKNKKQTAPSTSVFGTVKAKDVAAKESAVGDLPSTSITFTNFVNKILPQAKKVDCWLESKARIVTFITGFEGSKPLMQWHDDEGKNLASHYLWTAPPKVENHNLKSNQWNEVRCLIPFPYLWDGVPLTTKLPLVDPDGEEGTRYKYYHKKEGFRYLFVLEDNHEKNLGGSCLFPSFLKSDLHGVRSTIEAFSNAEPKHDVADGAAKGGFVGGVEANRARPDLKYKFRVRKFDGEISVYEIILFE